MMPMDASSCSALAWSRSDFGLVEFGFDLVDLVRHLVSGFDLVELWPWPERAEPRQLAVDVRYPFGHRATWSPDESNH